MVVGGDWCGGCVASPCVIPAHAGIHGWGGGAVSGANRWSVTMDPGVRRDDEFGAVEAYPERSGYGGRRLSPPDRHSRGGGNPDWLAFRVYRCGSEVMDSRLRGNDGVVGPGALLTLLPVARCPLPVARCPLPAARRLPPAACRLPPAFRRGPGIGRPPAPSKMTKTSSGCHGGDRPVRACR